MNEMTGVPGAALTPWDPLCRAADPLQREACYAAAVRLLNSFNLRLMHDARRALGDASVAPLALVRWLAGVSIGTDAAARHAREILLELGLPRTQHGLHVSLRALSEPLGIPRETLRRQSIRLAQREPLAMRPAPQLVLAREGEFLWVADQVARLLGASSPADIEAIDWGQLDDAARACRPEELPPVALFAAAASTETRLESVLLAGYLLRMLVRTIRVLGHDFRLAMILGEVAHYCVSAARPLEDDGGALPWSVFTRAGYAAGRAAGQLRSCGSYSLALAMDIPAETLRRKIHILRERGWVSRDVQGRLWMEACLLLDFAAFNHAQIEDLRATAALMNAARLGADE